MPDFLPPYGVTKGPLGVPCTDAQAYELDRVCRSLDDPEVKRFSAPPGSAAIDGERLDESWISTEDPDRVGDVVLARGMDPAHFEKNPVVALNHAYWLPPVGRCKRLWEDRTDSARGVKALTHYSHRPEGHSGEWGRNGVRYARLKTSVLREVGQVMEAKDSRDSGSRQASANPR